MRLADFLSSPVIAKLNLGRAPEQQRAAQQLRALAKPYRFRVRADAEGFPIIPGRYGQIEWYCDGMNCSSCLLPGQFALAVHTDRRRLFKKIWAIPGVRRHQTGDTEMRAVFPPEALQQVSAVIRAHRKPGISSETAQKTGAGTAFGGTSQVEEGRLLPKAGPSTRATGRRPGEAMK